ncbi:MAG: hypothetical protein R3D58_17435 [Saprospiraceae bacterium]|nr:hypothetical protein [Lewinellaceae bacterium]
MEPYDKQQFIEKWAKKRERGMGQFLLRNAPIFIVAMLLVGVGLDWAMGVDLNTAINTEILSAGLVKYAIFGLMAAWITWYFSERQYQKFTSDL